MNEIIKIIENDTIDLMEYHKGFLCEGDFPFRTPIHKNTTIMWPPVDIHPAAKIGENVVIGRYTNICGDVEIGDCTRIEGFCYIPDSISIGKYVFIGAGVVFANRKRPTIRYNQMKIRDGITVIEDEVSIGAGSIITPGVTIKKGTFIDPGTTVI